MRRRGVVTGTLIAAALAMTACYGGDSNGPRVAIQGDSITTLSTGAIENTLGQNYGWNVQAQGGNTFQNRTESLEDQFNDPSGPPQDLIINLGTNDVFQYNTNGEAWRWGFLQIEGVAAYTGVCVVWVNVSTYADALLGNRPIAEEINAAIDQAAATDPHFHVLDWNSFIHEPGNFDQYIMPADDFGLDVHPNEAGQQQLADMYQTALQQDCGN